LLLPLDRGIKESAIKKKGDVRGKSHKYCKKGRRKNITVWHNPGQQKGVKERSAGAEKKKKGKRKTQSK